MFWKSACSEDGGVSNEAILTETGTGVGVQLLGDRVLAKAPAKINLHLEILGKRQDGYHEIETLMVAVDLYDDLEFREQPSGTLFSCNDRSAGVGDDNLVVRAANLVRRETGIQKGISIVLTKRIPVSAGLAGGSSDAAATLSALNAWWNLGWSRSRLAELGAELGSDVPFFFHAPAAVCRGRGEEVTAHRLGAKLHVTVVKPEFGLSTADVFRALEVGGPFRDVGPIVEALEKGDLQTVGASLFNRLESAAFVLSPETAERKRRLSAGARMGVLMSGSGSAVYALSADRNEAELIGRLASAEGLGAVYVASSCD